MTIVEEHKCKTKVECRIIKHEHSDKTINWTMNDSEYDHDITYCPYCGVNLYQNEKKESK
jgi:wobble nucleotide-excising tRNase